MRKDRIVCSIGLVLLRLVSGVQHGRAAQTPVGPPDLTKRRRRRGRRPFRRLVGSVRTTRAAGTPLSLSP